MKITNKFNVPETLFALASRDSYSKGKADYSVTEIISPPRIQRLRETHWHELEQDVADMLWSLLGSALHVVAERSQVANHTTEERLYVKLNGVTLSGAIDLQHDTGDGIIITDYKFTSAWAVRSDKPEWEQQQNIYKYLVETVKHTPVKALRICALIRDWSRREAAAKPDYPQSPIQIVELPMWTHQEAEAFIKERLELHRMAKVASDWGEELPACSEEDRWQRDTAYAVKRKDRKRAIRIFATCEEAEMYAADVQDGYVETRLGEPVRCTGNFCGVAKWCTQFKQENNDE